MLYLEKFPTRKYRWRVASDEYYERGPVLRLQLESMLDLVHRLNLENRFDQHTINQWTGSKVFSNYVEFTTKRDAQWFMLAYEGVNG